MSSINTPKPDSLEDKANRQLFALLCEYFKDGWSNARIREFYPETLEIKVNDFHTLKTHTYTFDATNILTDHFLNDARALLKKLVTEQKPAQHEAPHC